MESSKAKRKSRKMRKLRKRWQLPTNRGDTRMKPFRPLCPLHDTEKIRMLMRRPIESEEEEYCKYPDSKCNICHSPDHIACECSFLEEIPEGAVIGRSYDKVCKTCGSIGTTCSCKVGSYAAPKYCTACHVSDHWYWEECCSSESPWMPLLLITDKSAELRYKINLMSSGDRVCCQDRAESEVQQGLKELSMHQLCV